MLFVLKYNRINDKVRGQSGRFEYKWKFVNQFEDLYIKYDPRPLEIMI